MERLSREIEGVYVVAEKYIARCEDGWCGAAADRLAKFENAYFALIKAQEETTAELEKMRGEGKTKSVKFRQLFARKLMNNEMLALFEKQGL